MTVLSTANVNRLEYCSRCSRLLDISPCSIFEIFNTAMEMDILCTGNPDHIFKGHVNKRSTCQSFVLRIEL